MVCPIDCLYVPQENLNMIARWLGDGKLRPFIRCVGLDDVGDALAQLEDREVVGKLCVQMADTPSKL